MQRLLQTSTSKASRCGGREVVKVSASPSLMPESLHVTGRLTQSGKVGASLMSVRRTRVVANDPEAALTWGGEESSVARLNLISLPASEILHGRRSIVLAPRSAMETSFRNVHEPCAWTMAHPVDQIVFDLPVAAVAEWLEARLPRRTILPDRQSGSASADVTLKAFGLAALPYLGGRMRSDPFFVDHLLDGVCHYIFGRFGIDSRDRTSGLAPWQERRAKEMMSASPLTGPSLPDLAAACGLSSAHFTRAFRTTCGMTPHRWLMARRVERAEHLLRKGDMPLAAIAVECGFSDQAHLTNVISRHFGSPPGVLRRYWRSEDRGPLATAKAEGVKRP